MDLSLVRADPARMQAEGKTVVLIGQSSGSQPSAVSGLPSVVGLIAIADTPKEDAHEAVARMKAAGLRPIMITRDNARTARAVAVGVGIAIGAGTDIAIEAADVILVGERLGGVVDAYYIARASYRKMVQNLALAFWRRQGWFIRHGL